MMNFKLKTKNYYKSLQMNKKKYNKIKENY